MKKLIFIDNDLTEKAEENKRIAQSRLFYNGGLNSVVVNSMTLIDNFHHKQTRLEHQMFDINNVIVTWSMFTDNHFGSYDQLCAFMVMAGLTEVKGKVFIDTATYLRDTLERAIEHYNQAIYIIRCIENNYIIHYDEDDSKFYRLRFDVNSDDFLKNEDVNLSELLT